MASRRVPKPSSLVYDPEITLSGCMAGALQPPHRARVRGIAGIPEGFRDRGAAAPARDYRSGRSGTPFCKRYADAGLGKTVVLFVLDVLQEMFDQRGGDEKPGVLHEKRKERNRFAGGGLGGRG